MSFYKFKINTNDSEISEGIPKLISLAIQDDVIALCMLANYLEENIIIDHNDPDKALKLYEKAAEKGNTNAMFKAGSIYEAKGLEDKAIYWYKKAINTGHIKAKYNLANLLAEQVIINFDQQKFNDAMALLFRAALDNVPEAQCKVAEIYDFRNEKNLALSWYNGAALQGFPFGEEMKNKLLDEIGIVSITLPQQVLEEVVSYQKFQSVCGISA